MRVAAENARISPRPGARGRRHDRGEQPCASCIAAAAALFVRPRGRLRRSGREEDLHAAELHDGRRQDAQGREGRLRDLRQAQRGRRQRDLRAALLHRHVARRGQVRAVATPRPATGIRSSVPGVRSTPTSISSSAPMRSRISIRRTRTSSRRVRRRSIPHTGKPWGLAFPVVSLRDSVRVHKALVDSLGVKKLQAVAGPSGGSIQAMEWAARLSRISSSAWST